MSQPFIGEIKPCGFNFAPLGYAFCDGSLQSIDQNQALYALIGTTFGGDGVQTFGLPDLRGRVPVGQGAGPGLSPLIIGEVYGVESVTLTTQQLPSHTHTVGVSTAAASTVNPSNGYPALSARKVYGTTSLTAMSANSIPTAGSSFAHENRQPYLVISFCIAIEGIFPSRN